VEYKQAVDMLQDAPRFDAALLESAGLSRLQIHSLPQAETIIRKVAARDDEIFAQVLGRVPLHKAGDDTFAIMQAMGVASLDGQPQVNLATDQEDTQIIPFPKQA